MASLVSVQEAMAGAASGSTSGGVVIQAQHFQLALGRVKPSVSPKVRLIVCALVVISCFVCVGRLKSKAALILSPGICCRC